MEKEEIVPDCIDRVPEEVLQVSYPSGVKVDLGNELTPLQVKDEPSLKWSADTNAFYTVSMVDPDAPSRLNPEFREINHWLVVNVPGANISKGEVLADYIGSGPPEGSGLHRYVFLIYKQNGKTSFKESPIPKGSREKRINFSIKKFAEKYNLGEPVAGNFYQAQYDEYVGQMRARQAQQK